MKLKIEELRKEICGIYILYLDNKIVYVGQSVNMYSRIQTHLSEGIKSFDEVEFIPTQYELLKKEELKLIEQHTPVYNISGNPLAQERGNRRPLVKRESKEFIASKWFPIEEPSILFKDKIARKHIAPQPQPKNTSSVQCVLSTGERKLLSNNTYIKQQHQTIVKIRGDEYIVPKDTTLFVLSHVEYLISDDVFGLLRLA